MAKFLWWTFGIFAAISLVMGVGTAAVLMVTFAKTSGNSGGLMVNGVPTFFQGFKEGYDAGANRSGQQGMTSWQGQGTLRYQGQQPRQQQPQNRPPRQPGSAPVSQR